MKMREARRLLASGQRRVGEVAEHLAFANAFHFSRRFTSFYPITPSELRWRATVRWRCSFTVVGFWVTLSITDA